MPAAPVSAIQGSFTELDFSEADVVNYCNVLFPDFVQEEVADKFALLKEGSRIICLKYLPERPYLKLEATCTSKFSWGLHEVLFYSVTSV